MAELRRCLRDMAVPLAPEAGFGSTCHTVEKRANQVDIAAATISDVGPCEGVPVPTIKTPRYDGKTGLGAFQAQFKLLAQAARWSTGEKVL